MLKKNAWKKFAFAALLLLFLATLIIPITRGQSPFSLGLDLAGGAMVTYRIDAASVPERLADLPQDHLLQLAKDAIAGRLAQRFDTLPDVAVRDDGRLIVNVPGEHEQRRVLETLGQTYRLGFRLVLTTHEAEPATGRGLVRLYEGRWLDLGPEQLDGSMLDPRSIRVDSGEASWDVGRGAAITFEFAKPHDESFARLTGENLGQSLAILLDDEIEWVGKVESEIRGPGLLRGGYTIEEAAEVASLLRAGQLPFSLEVESLSAVGPTLGQEMATRGLTALAWSAGALLLLLLLAYGHRPALLITGWASLAFLLLTTLGLIAVMLLTVDLVAIAGLVLSIGMGMDAFILVFEALESGRYGQDKRSPLGRIRAVYGWGGEGRTLLHANATTLLVVLLLFMAERLASFALFLCVGLLASLSTLLLTRSLLEAFARRGWLETHERKPSRLDRLRQARPGLFRWRRVYATLLVLFLLATTLAIAMGAVPAELGHDFKPGVQLRIAIAPDAIEPLVEDLRASQPGTEVRHQTWQPPGNAELPSGQSGFLLTTGDPGDAEAPLTEWLPKMLERHGATPFGVESIDARLSAGRLLSSLTVFIGSFTLLGLYLRYVQPRLDSALVPARQGAHADGVEASANHGSRVLIGTVLAVIFDVLAVLGVLALLGIPFGLPALAAILTIVGYSVNDSMVLWSHLSTGDGSQQSVSRIVDRLLSRTLLTSLSTLIPAIAMLVAGLEPLRGFAWAVLIGTIAGTLSSTFIVASFARPPSSYETAFLDAI